MRGDITKKILEILSIAAIDAVDYLDAFLSAGYGASMNKLEYEFRKRKEAREKAFLQEQEISRYHQRCYSFAHKLKRDGLIAEKKKDGRRLLSITAKGRQKLQQLRDESLPQKQYNASPYNRSTIIVFDIPESERRKRAWLRDVLGNLGFKMLQKSVWVGKTKVPQDFIDDLVKLRLIQYVEIFEISKRGSIERVME